jgi:ATP phosphoribosyltransferase
MRFALPKGRPLKGVLDLLERGGITFRFAGDRNYTGEGNEPGLQGKQIKARAVPQMVALGNFEVGFCGLDLLSDSGYDQTVPLLDLGLARVEIVVAVARSQQTLLDDPPRRPLLIATEYERIADAWALRRGLAHITIQTHGSTEAYLPEDADIIVDCVETGRTLEANDLCALEHLMVSTTHLVANRHALERPGTGDAIRALVERMRPVVAPSAGSR